MQNSATKDTERNNTDWLAALGSEGLAAQEAMRDLTRILRHNLSRAFSNHGGVDETALDDFVQEALMKITRSLESFRGDSRLPKTKRPTSARLKAIGRSSSRATASNFEDTAPRCSAQRGRFVYVASERR